MRSLTSSVVIAASLSLMSCNRLWSGVTEMITGDGHIVTSERQLAQFDKIELDGSYDVTLTQGPASAIRIEADSNLLLHVTSEIKGGKLIVSSEGNLHPSNRIKLFISSAAFNAVAIDGSADVRATSPITSDDLRLGLEGSGTYDLDVHAKTITSSIEGSGKIILRGDAGVHKVNIDGSGDLLAFDMASERTDITISGSGNASLNATKQIEATISGSGNVRYKGTAQDLKTSIEGSGKIERVSQ